MENMWRGPTLLLVWLVPLCSAGGFAWGLDCSSVCPAEYFTTTYGVRCTDACEKRGYDYYWCESSEGWDYCSPGVNLDYQGQTCRSTHPCDKHGGSEFQCLLDSFQWGKCAIVEPKAMIHHTKELHTCLDRCRYDQSGDYFYCYLADGNWDYCSPLPDHTVKNEPCRYDSSCGSHGYDYNWCNTADSWDYCGPISPGECQYTSSSRRRKRQPNNSKVICTREDNNNRVTTRFLDDGGGHNIASVTNRMRNEALDLINQWDGQRLTEQSRSNLVTSDNLRIDNQGMCTRDNQRCYNLQIQINRPRGSGQSTTIANIIAPVDSPMDYQRLAFQESLQRQTRVLLQSAEATSSNVRPNQKCCRRRKQ